MIRITGLSFRYHGSDFRLHVPDLEIDRGASVAFTGPSGSGKTTLVNLIAGIRTPNAGRITVDGVDVHALGDTARRRFRIRNLGLVFQEFELIEYLDVLDNILMPYRIGSELKLDSSVRKRAVELAETVEIGDKLRRYVRRLSHGERQRVALCRALLTRPGLVLADEPTGNLDPANKLHVLDLLFDCAREADATLVVITHDHDLLDRFDRVLDFKQFHDQPEASPA
jgi:putative ABC transport system ATP-binding protein